MALTLIYLELHLPCLTVAALLMILTVGEVVLSRRLRFLQGAIFGGAALLDQETTSGADS